MRAISIALFCLLFAHPAWAGGAAGSSATPDDAALTVTRTFPGTAASYPVTLRLFNPGDTVGGSDYQNEVHLSLQAGTTTHHRRYLDFTGPDGVNDWVFGVNSMNAMIAYDVNDATHRLYFENVATGGGDSIINSAGSGAVQINGDADDTSEGTGGLEVWSGGGAPAKVFAVTGAGVIIAEVGGSANKAVCWKSDGKTLGYCSSLVGADGSCTCN